MANFIYITGNLGIKRLCLEELNGNYPNWFLDSEVMRFNSHWAFPLSKNEVEDYVNNLKSDRSRLVFAIYHLSDDCHIGNISLQAINHLHRQAELAFMFGEKAYWSKGYAYESAKVIIEHGFSHLNLNRIFLGCLANNMGMKKLAEKLGFMKEGVRRSSFFKDGVFQDIEDYGLLYDEFK